MTGPVFGQDPTDAGWVGARLTGRLGHITGTIPAGFAAYARIFHSIEGDGRSVRWSEVAEAAGTRVHPLAQWRRVARPYPGVRHWWQDVAPEEGNLPVESLQRLLSVLRLHTTTPQDCWFCLWKGYGWIHGSPSVVFFGFGGETRGADDDIPPAYPDDWLDPALEVQHPHREYLLGRGPLESALGIGHHISDDWFDPQSPNLFWPADRAWCVATEIDFDSTLVAGSAGLIDDVLSAPDLEAWPIAPDDCLCHKADRIN